MKKKYNLEDEVIRLRASVEELTILNDLAIAVSGTKEVDDVLDLIVEKSIKSLKAEQGSILLLTEQQKTPLKTLVRQIDNTSLISSYKVGSHITGWVLQKKQPLMIKNLSKDERFVTTREEQEQIRTVICVPISAAGELIGVLMMTNKKTGDAFNSEDLRLLTILASQSGQLIKNSWLQEEALIKRSMERELEIARDIQIGLLPKNPPHLPGLDLANYFQPASQVAGDYYDFIQIGEKNTGIVLADVSGHGPSAALIMTMVKGVLHSLIPRFDSVDKMMSEINNTMNPIIPPEIFITMVFLLVNLENMTLRYSNAGHPPMIHVNKRLRIFEAVDLHGCAINMIKNPKFSTINFPLESDSIFVIYTDGIIEIQNNKGEMFGVNRLLNTIKGNCERSAEEIVIHIIDEMKTFSAPDQLYSDDSAMVVLKVV
ncbi:MAG: GAF domain-containing SpoIIE family protein phosphatase [Candidatus Neomarinimicrobiota bacterium]